MIMLDTAVWIALMKTDDTNHNKAKKMVKKIHPSEVEVFDHIYVETLTVLRYKLTAPACKKFVDFLKRFKKQIVLSNKEIFTYANKLFFRHSDLSFTDCLLISSAKINNAKLLTFDKNLQKAWEKC